MCSVTIRWLLRFPAFSTLSKHMGRQAGESKALAVLHKPAPILGRCHTALCRYHPEEVLILPEKCSYRKTDQRVDDPPEHKCCLVSTCSECPEVPTALEQMHQGKNNIKHLLWLIRQVPLGSATYSSCHDYYFQTGFHEHHFA